MFRQKKAFNPLQTALDAGPTPQASNVPQQGVGASMGLPPMPLASNAQGAFGALGGIFSGGGGGNAAHTIADKMRAPQAPGISAGLGGFAAPQGDPSGLSGATVPPGAKAPSAFQTQLMEGDPTKLADASHAAKSPKYDFLQLAQQNKFNYDQLPEMLSALQGGPNARLWNGWSANKDKLTFNGDPSQLAPEWNGAKSVDAIGAYGDFANGGNAKGFRWGVDGPAGAPGGAPAQMTQGSPMMFDNPNVSAADIPQTQGSANSVLQQILASMNDPSLQRALRY